MTDGGHKRSVAIANMGTVVMPLSGNGKYPQIARDFARTFEKQKQLAPDIWVAAHASQYGMAEKHKRGSFIDPQGYKRAMERYESLFLAEMETRRAK